MTLKYNVTFCIFIILDLLHLDFNTLLGLRDVFCLNDKNWQLILDILQIQRHSVYFVLNTEHSNEFKKNL